MISIAMKEIQRKRAEAHFGGWTMKAGLAVRVLTAAVLGVCASAANAVTVTIACGSSGGDVQFCQRHAEDWAKKTGNTVKHYSPPTSATEKLALFRQLFAAKSGDIDVIQTDVIWPGIIKDHLLDLNKYAPNAAKEYFPAMLANNTVDGKLLALPWYTDAGLLYYRKDLLEKHKEKVPTTWDEFTATAKKIQEAERKGGIADFHGLVFQAKAYEGLTCNAIEWVASHGGGTIIEPDGRISINNPKAIAGLKMAASWVGDIAPRGVLNYEEEDARGVFQNGKALFMRNWPYAYAPSQKADSPIKGKVGVAPLPKAAGAAKGGAALGGWSLSVVKYSKNPAVAADLAVYMSSAAVQKDRAINGGFNPTRPEVYKDKDVIAANPFVASLEDVFVNATPRPATATGLKYPEVSQAFWDATHEVLSGKAKAEDAVKKLEGKLNQVRRGKW
jgi:trehalose/maltose transport system substrate-binding protein